MGDGHDCAEAVEQLYHFLDGQLTEERRTIIRQHLDDCPPCLDAFDFEVELRVVIQHKCRDHVPDHLMKRVFAAIEELHHTDLEANGPEA